MCFSLRLRNKPLQFFGSLCLDILSLEHHLFDPFKLCLVYFRIIILIDTLAILNVC